MELARATTEAIYGGHISGRRLRGVKVNPIYQENETSRNGDGSDTQSECGVPVGEITIEMYESLPRHQPIRLSVSAPDMPIANISDGYISVAPIDLSEDIQNGLWDGAAGQRYIASPVPKLSDQGSKRNKVKSGEKLTSDPGEKRSTTKKSRWHRKKLTRQKRFDPLGDDPDAIEIVNSSPSTSGYSSPSSSFYSSRTLISTTDNANPSRSSSKRRQLSALKEQTSSMERTEENDFEIGDDSDEADSVFNGGLNNNDLRNDDSGDVTRNDVGRGEILSGNSRRNMINDLINLQDQQSNVVIRPDMDTLSAGTQRLHRASISSLDVMNNNEMSVPDRMLQHYGRTDRSANGVNTDNIHNDALLDGIRSDSLMDTYMNDALVEGLSLDPVTLQGEDYIVYDTFSLRALFSLSNSSSIDSGYRAMEAMKGSVHCECRGKPTLKCACGRVALQKILKEQHEAKKRANNWLSSVADEVTFELSGYDDSSPRVGYSVKSDQDKPVRSSSIKQDTRRTPQKLQNDKASAQTPRNIERKSVTFAKGTIFNDNKRVKYVKECISRTALRMRPSELDDNSRGIDNLGYEHVTGFLTDDEKVLRRTALEHPSAKNRIDKQGSLLLTVSNLNAPAYMHAYLLGFNQEPEVPSLKSDTENRAAPVSIEAIGGITTDDPAFDVIGEAAEEDFEYYRRRRKQKRGLYDDNSLDGWKNKRSRCRKIKICVIIITIVVVVIAGIALAIHFGAPAGGGYGTMVTSASVGDDVGQFSRVLI